MTGCLSITVTAGDKAEAMIIAEVLVEEKLAACVNIIPGVSAFYRWKDAVEQQEEFMLLIKTRAALFEAVAARIKELHSYDCPCIVAEAIVAGDDHYMRWILENTKG